MPIATVDYLIGGNPVTVTGQLAGFKWCTCGLHDISKECVTVHRPDHRSVCIPLSIVEKITEISVEGLTTPSD